MSLRAWWASRFGAKKHAREEARKRQEEELRELELELDFVRAQRDDVEAAEATERGAHLDTLALARIGAEREASRTQPARPRQITFPDLAEFVGE